MKKLMSFLLSRAVIVGALLALQAVFLLVIIWRFSRYLVYFYAVFELLSMAVVLWLVNKTTNPGYKIAWIIPILIFPVFGGLFYVIFGVRRSDKGMWQRLTASTRRGERFLQQDPAVWAHLEQESPAVVNQLAYIRDRSHFPVHENTETEYLTPGEKKFEVMKRELRKAKRFIFLEYFILEEGIMWNSILSILEQKVREGVDVRVVYDDVGSLNTLPFHYNERLEQAGIKCRVFNPFVPALNSRLNNRDHRKIMVVDGHTGITGGINLADEYINAYAKHGHWKDAAVLLRGQAVWNLTIMFLTMWDFLSGTESDYEQYAPQPQDVGHIQAPGYVLPYSDSPIDDELVGEMVYLNMINRANRYVYINTPYLIVDNETTTSLILAAKSGVDVRIVTPHIADKWYVHMMTRAAYQQLIENGVKIYEYTPGFVHAKTFVCDDEVGVVGTINLDYRSLYLHFECAAFLYRTASVGQIRDDYLKTLELCREITLEDCRRVKPATRLLRSIMRVFAPLM